MWWMTLFLISVVHGKEWDILIFTQHWPPTACAQYMEEGAGHTCVRPTVDNSWMIHGVWPTKLGTLGPAFCESIPFDEDEVADLVSQLVTFWPNLEGGKTTESLWEHEWLKHGTCARTLPALSTENEYFYQGLDWFSRYNMAVILGKKGIVPSQSNEYRVEDIHNAVKSTTGKNPSIRCIHEKHTKKAWLFELRICFDKNLQLVDCDGTAEESSRIITNCPLEQSILYPIHAISPPEELLPPFRRKRSIARELRDMIDLFMFLDWLL